jgi:hypothetical protein
VGPGQPRARRRLARGGVRPSSEAEISWRRTWSSSEVETRPRGTATVCFVVRCGFLGRGPFRFGPRPYTEHVGVCGFVCFAFYYFSKRAFSLVMKGPLWLSPTLSLPPKLSNESRSQDDTAGVLVLSQSQWQCHRYSYQICRISFFSMMILSLSVHRFMT